jgi:outer membrane murein-binding lipoprotein Lpp
MASLINLLIIFFFILLVYQIFLAYTNNTILEGITNPQYQPYNINDPNNALILAQQNAGNIAALKGQFDDLNGLNSEVQDISANVVQLQQQVTQLVAAQQNYASKMTGGTTPNISGAVQSSSDSSSSSTSNT